MEQNTVQKGAFTYDQLWFSAKVPNDSLEKIAPSANGAETNGYSHAKEQQWTPSWHLTQILTDNGS